MSYDRLFQYAEPSRVRIVERRSWHFNKDLLIGSAWGLVLSSPVWILAGIGILAWLKGY